MQHFKLLILDTKRGKDEEFFFGVQNSMKKLIWKRSKSKFGQEHAGIRAQRSVVTHKKHGQRITTFRHKEGKTHHLIHVDQFARG
jgi:hypothetical protein